MQYLPWAVFVLSFSVLIFILLRNKHSVQWLGHVGVQIVLASILLYGVNWIGGFYGFRLPINVTTVAAVAFLGIPGLGLLTAVKLILV